MKLDPIDYAVISQAIQAAADEAGTKLVKSAYTPILREAQDGSAAPLAVIARSRWRRGNLLPPML